jgi:hypothetical protein
MRTANQKDRLAKLKQGEGVFVYAGGAFDTEAIPGVPLIGKDGNQVRTVPIIEVEQEDGTKVQVADPKAGNKGVLVWKRAPQFKRTEIAVFRLPIAGVFGEYDESSKSYIVKPDVHGEVKPLFLEFKKGDPVFVGDPRQALKLRCLKCFKEVEDVSKPAAPVESKPKAKGEKSAAV